MIRELKCPYGDDFEGGDECDRCEQYELCMETYPPVNLIEIPKGATNGDMIKTMFGIADNDIDEGLSTTYVYTKTRVLKGGSQDYLRKQITFNRDWWNAQYKRGNEDGSN